MLLAGSWGCYAPVIIPSIVSWSTMMTPGSCMEMCRTEFLLVGPTPWDLGGSFYCACTDMTPDLDEETLGSCDLPCPAEPDMLCGGYNDETGVVSWSLYYNDLAEVVAFKAVDTASVSSTTPPSFRLIRIFETTTTTTTTTTTDIRRPVRTQTTIADKPAPPTSTIGVSDGPPNQRMFPIIATSSVLNSNPNVPTSTQTIYPTTSSNDASGNKGAVAGFGRPPGLDATGVSSAGGITISPNSNGVGQPPPPPGDSNGIPAGLATDAAPQQLSTVLIGGIAAATVCMILGVAGVTVLRQRRRKNQEQLRDREDEEYEFSLVERVGTRTRAESDAKRIVEVFGLDDEVMRDIPGLTMLSIQSGSLVSANVIGNGRKVDVASTMRTLANVPHATVGVMPVMLRNGLAAIDTSDDLDETQSSILSPDGDIEFPSKDPQVSVNESSIYMDILLQNGQFEEDELAREAAAARSSNGRSSNIDGHL
ncbi:hypothetical protein HDU79_002558 [Rhizoclosmatium sp. JEL0117]|nr:hypothetical protein HDU79_002558 [Rhizoclosmatium sp. JEL0117]